MSTDFQQTVLDYYYEHQRTLAWRQPPFDPYSIMVSEVMLQQTQVSRVIEKYAQFLEVFPSVGALAHASLQDVLSVWQGLGYSRRGKFLRDAAKIVMAEFGGVMPRTVAELVRLPGVGHNTACAIAVYAYNQPLVYIETNIRSVYLHHFFQGQELVTDTMILEKVADTLYVENPREWYWALMDYGTYIKKQYGNPNVRSRHYVRQSAFAGSKREIRGKVLKALTAAPHSEADLQLITTDERLSRVLADLLAEQLIQKQGSTYVIAS